MATDRSDWVRTYLDPNQNPAAVTRAANRIAGARGLPMVVPKPAPGVTVRGVRMDTAVLMHPEVHAEWSGRSQVREKARVTAGRRKATGKARLNKKAGV